MKNSLPKILFLLLTLFSAGASAELFNAEEFTLENGLRCVVIQNHKAPLIKQMVWYVAGSADEEAGKGGSAHLLEHLMFRGTEKVKDGEFNRIMNENGVEANAFTSHDVTVYHEFADISRLEVLMALEADRMQNLNFDEKAFEAERKIVFQERMQRVENKPSSPFFEKMRRDLFGTSAYGKPVTGENEEILNLTAEDVRSFYERYYAPDNAILVLSGDIDTETAKKLAEKYYGKIPARGTAHKQRNISREIFSQSLVMKLSGVKSPKMVWLYRLPNYAELSGSFYDYLLLEAYLGGGESSQLYRKLVLNEGKAVAVSAGYDFVTRGDGIFQLTMIPTAQDNKMFPMQKTVKELVDRLDEKELEKVKKKMLADLVFTNDNPEDAAYLVGSMLANGLSLEDIQDYENKVAAVKLEDVKKAYEYIFTRTPVIKGLLLPRTETEND